MILSICRHRVWGNLGFLLSCLLYVLTTLEAWCDGIQMSQDLNISLLLNCFYLTEYCQVGALNLIGIGYSMFSFLFSLYPSYLIFVFDIWLFINFWHTVMLYTFSAKYCVLCLHISFSFIKHDRMLRFLS